MTDAPTWEDRYHPQKMFSSGSAPKGWSDEFRFCPYLRADIAAAREAELRAELERLTQANREAAMQSLADLGQAQEALERAVAAEAERDKVRDLYRSTLLELQRADADNARLRALLNEAREGLTEAACELDSYYRAEWGLDHPLHQRNLKFAMDNNCARAALAKIGGQHD